MDERERLTRRNPDGGINVDDLPAALEKLAAYEGAEAESEAESEAGFSILANAIEELFKFREYLDAEEQGRLVRLPCAVGDTVYSVYRGDIKETKVQAITISKFGLEFQDGFQGNWVFHTDSIGKTVFLTRAEAQAALKAREAAI